MSTYLRAKDVFAARPARKQRTKRRPNASRSPTKAWAKVPLKSASATGTTAFRAYPRPFSTIAINTTTGARYSTPPIKVVLRKLYIYVSPPFAQRDQHGALDRRMRHVLDLDPVPRASRAVAAVAPLGD